MKHSPRRVLSVVLLSIPFGLFLWLAHSLHAATKTICYLPDPNINSDHRFSQNKSLSINAFATMLTSNDPVDDLNNNYFISARLVVSRLVHHPKIRTTRDVIGIYRFINSPCDRKYIKKDAKDIGA
jgi:hypothetical protein